MAEWLFKSTCPCEFTNRQLPSMTRPTRLATLVSPIPDITDDFCQFPLLLLSQSSVFSSTLPLFQSPFHLGRPQAESPSADLVGADSRTTAPSLSMQQVSLRHTSGRVPLLLLREP